MMLKSVTRCIFLIGGFHYPRIPNMNSGTESALARAMTIGKKHHLEKHIKSVFIRPNNHVTTAFYLLQLVNCAPGQTLLCF